MVIIIAGSLCLGLLLFKSTLPMASWESTALYNLLNLWVDLTDKAVQQINQLGGGNLGWCAVERRAGSLRLETRSSFFFTQFLSVGLFRLPWHFSERNTEKQQFLGQGSSISMPHIKGGACCPGHWCWWAGERKHARMPYVLKEILSLPLSCSPQCVRTALS